MNHIGINKDKATELSDQLNTLLATYEVFYQNLRSAHWNVKGENFFELHVKFEELYTDAQLKIDEVAERILTLGAGPLDSYTAFLRESKVKEFSGVSDGRQCVETIRDNFTLIIELERSILESAEAVGDTGSADLMTQYISAQEKTVWMLTAFLS